MADMTPTQGRYLAYIHEYTEGFGLPPAESEISDAIGVSPPSVNQMMKTLEKKGLIRRQPGVPRSVEVLVAPDALPKWKGKRITRTVREWTLTHPAGRQPGQSSGGQAAVYRFKIVLQDTDPAIWRRIETKDVTLGQLHALIQTAMGWTDSHLHQFEIAGSRYTDPRFMMDDMDDFGAIDYSRLRVSELVAKHGAKLRMGYEYDVGDGWQHEIVLEKVTESERGIRYPRESGTPAASMERAPVPRKMWAAFTVSPTSSRRLRIRITSSTTTTWSGTARSTPRTLLRQRPLVA